MPVPLLLLFFAQLLLTVSFAHYCYYFFHSWTARQIPLSAVMHYRSTLGLTKPRTKEGSPSHHNEVLFFCFSLFLRSLPLYMRLTKQACSFSDGRTDERANRKKEKKRKKGRKQLQLKRFVPSLSVLGLLKNLFPLLLLHSLWLARSRIVGCKLGRKREYIYSTRILYLILSPDPTFFFLLFLAFVYSSIRVETCSSWINIINVDVLSWGLKCIHHIGIL